MEVSRLQSDLKYIEANGVTLSIEERIQLELALANLRTDLPSSAGKLFFWGKIRGKPAPPPCN